ncbi:hypothetical protein CJU89_3664 [Yarrowia sp. B02]|nr:hypothetical protein CJU89_3664 [Yarrowia sp. B02]
MVRSIIGMAKAVKKEPAEPVSRVSSDSDDSDVEVIPKPTPRKMPAKVTKKPSKRQSRVEQLSQASQSPRYTPKLKSVPKNYFAPDYASPGPSQTPRNRGTPSRVPVGAPRQGNVRITMVRGKPDGSEETYVYASVPKTTLVSQLIFNLPKTWNTRRSDVYSVGGEVIHDIETASLMSVGLEDGGVIDAVSRGTSG